MQACEYGKAEVDIKGCVNETKILASAAPHVSIVNKTKIEQKMAKIKRKANLAASTASKKSKVTKQNPFEIRFNKEKHSVLNRKKKLSSGSKNEAVGRPGIARSRAIQIRKDTLLQEYKIRHKSNVFVDKRIGEKDSELSAEDKMIARFTAERMKSGSKNIFNLGEEENLTHYGQAISEIEQFDDDPRSDNEDEEAKKMSTEMNFGGFLTQNDIEFSTGKGNSRKEWIEQMIAESKKRKLELQKDKEDSLKMTQELDQTWKNMYGKLKMTAGLYSKKDVDEEDNVDTDDYNKLMKQLIFEPKKAQAQERLKTDEEIITEQKEMLEKLEELRQKRMKGEDDEEDSEEEEDPDENPDADPESGGDEQEESDKENADEDEYSDLEESEDENEEKNKAKAPKIQRAEKNEETPKVEIPFTFSVPKSSEELDELLQDKSAKVKGVILERMIKCNHPQFGKDNKAQLENLFAFLLQHIHDCADMDEEEFNTEDLQSIHTLTPFLFDLAKFSPQPAGEAVRSVIQEKYEEYLKNPKNCPTLDSLVFLKISALLFPTTDYRHPVATPALQWMSHILSTVKPFTRKSLAGCLFVACLMTESVSLSKKFVPTLWNFLCGVIFMAVSTKDVIPFVPPFKVIGVESTLLVGKLG